MAETVKITDSSLSHTSAQAANSPTTSPAVQISAPNSRKRQHSPETEGADVLASDAVTATKQSSENESHHIDQTSKGKVPSPIASGSQVSSRKIRSKARDRTNSDEELELLERDLHRQETAAWNAMTEEEQREHLIEKQKKALLAHIEPKIDTFATGGRFGFMQKFWNKKHDVRFRLQTAPRSHKGARCCLCTCPDRVYEGEHRIAVGPGTSGHWSGNPGKCSEVLYKHLQHLL